MLHTFILNLWFQIGSIRLLYLNVQSVTSLLPVTMTILRDHLKIRLNLDSSCRCPIANSEGERSKRATGVDNSKRVRHGMLVVWVSGILNCVILLWIKFQLMWFKTYLKRSWLINFYSNTMQEKLLKYDWLIRRAFFLNSGQKFLDPNWLKRFILSIRTKCQKHTQ